MTNRSEESHEPKPFDSRRTKPVKLVTPRNPPPAPHPSESTEKVDTGRSAPS
jgi:hypothetical protein